MVRSPFPGMDPYLEDPAGWPDVHHRLLTTISDALADAVSPDFYVRVEERIYLTDTLLGFVSKRVVPDIVLTRRPRHQGVQMVLTATAPTTVPSVEEEAVFNEETRDYYLEIRDARYHEVITAIELLSPANKIENSPGYRKLCEKRDQLWNGGVNWLEIDLLRDGYREPSLAGESDYCVMLLHQLKQKKLRWFIDLRDPLPTVPVPLRPPYQDAPLNVQQALLTAYHRAHYADSVDYTREPPPPRMKPADAAWVRGLVEAWLNRS